ncbi:ORF040 [Saltwater crocodilepox virus]|nr:ORF040 [Saltwater crocodilepox virus]
MRVVTLAESMAVAMYRSTQNYLDFTGKAISTQIETEKQLHWMELTALSDVVEDVVSRHRYASLDLIDRVAANLVTSNLFPLGVRERLSTVGLMVTHAPRPRASRPVSSLTEMSTVKARQPRPSRRREGSDLRETCPEATAKIASRLRDNLRRLARQKAICEVKIKEFYRLREIARDDRSTASRARAEAERTSMRSSLSRLCCISKRIVNIVRSRHLSQLLDDVSPTCQRVGEILEELAENLNANYVVV